MELTHFNNAGQPNMVDVGEKTATHRAATACATITMTPDTLHLIQTGGTTKGDVFAVAQVAGIQAAKRTWELIPLCHPLALTGVDISFRPQETPPAVHIEATVRCIGVTGVEMEALTAVSVAALTIYDMVKSAQKDMEITGIHLVEKTGGKSDYRQEGADD
ncbi:MAG: cyclic pyranopterin monophosphate synthase MoaC [Oscillospiraceae bacterium]|nr:cyclic pyranopterin monophosphate synthase MoaC [Oscillospiraceae bacterium]